MCLSGFLFHSLSLPEVLNRDVSPFSNRYVGFFATTLVPRIECYRTYGRALSFSFGIRSVSICRRRRSVSLGMMGKRNQRRMSKGVKSWFQGGLPNRVKTWFQQGIQCSVEK